MSGVMYSLWLKPTGEVYDLLNDTIRRLARELGTSPFEPHVTLHAPLEGIEQQHTHRTEEIARRLRAFPVALTEASYTDEHFRCLFMLARKTPAIMGANALARRVFGESSQAQYLPHLSLVYGSFPEPRKKEIIARLPSHVRSSFDATALHLIRAASDDPKDWHEVAVFRIDQGSPDVAGNPRAIQGTL